jgi:hypothetical protein
MSREKSEVPCKPIFLRAPIPLDELVEHIARIERRTKTAVLGLALEEYVERHHPEEYAQYKGVAA